MVWHFRPHLDRLEQEYLETPAGGCCLPVAYIVSYGHHAEGRIEQWIEKLDARLDDDALTGDRRVNWLLARADAEEIRRSRAGRHFVPTHRFLAGREWIEGACLVAQSEPARLRAFKELAVRMTVDERLDSARQVLDHAAERCTSGESVAALTQWRSELDVLSQAFDARRAQRQVVAEQAYIDRLRARHQNALDRGDSQATARYEQLLTGTGD